ncbi:MAG: type II toxin-antitoxin system VapC family toxin [Bacteroidia bacterium]|nr:type II toxin-antitoxin system VapC family toxin [Bacteroidia bacterium]
MLVDTNIVLGYLSRYFENPILLALEEVFLYQFEISIITRIELLGYPKLTEDQEQHLSILLNQANIHFISEDIAEEAIKIRRSYNLKLGDSIIGATALVSNQPLLTADLRGFQNIKGLELLRPEGLV